MRWWWLWLETFFLLALCSTAAATEGKSRLTCPEKCPPCVEEPHCEHTILDQCDCCPVCLRQLGEKCGSTLGVCASNLTCTQLNDTDEFGVCTEMYPVRCLKANCGVVFHPQCPQDSRLVILPPPAGQCCGPPGKCHCDQQKCEAFVPVCDEGMERVLIRDGKAEPGECCDVFECQPQKSQCADVSCPEVPPPDEDDNESCPADSVRPAVHVPQGACCPIRAGCRCRASECRPAICPEGRRLKIIRKGNGNPGRCCDEWQCDDDPKPMGKSCERDGKIYNDGQEWSSSSCETCKCKKGVAVCSKMSCPKTPVDCTWVAIPDGECCPVCVGCQTDKREKKQKNETWAKDDCTTCTCSEEGMAVCEKYMCTASCENPRKVEGQCCPVCDEPSIVALPANCPSLEHCPLRCENGLQRDDRGCFECKCLPSDNAVSTSCPQLNKNNCDKQCAHGYMKDNKGCLVCKCAKCPPLQQCYKQCLYGFETNSAGCPVCKCRAVRVSAKITTTEKGGKSWDKCVTTDSNGNKVEHDSGEWWNDGCRHCFCEQKQEFCSLISCSQRPSDCPEENWVRKEGECCHSCTTPTSSSEVSMINHGHTICHSPGTGRLFTDGETWALPTCVSCTCRVGQILCRAPECPPVACKHPEFHANDQCCPKCINANMSVIHTRGELITCLDTSKGNRHSVEVGAIWRTDDCTSCTCTDQGSVVCYRETCDSIEDCKGSPLVIKGRCCPVCSDVLSSSEMCVYKSDVYSINEEWKDGDCTKCSCVAGGQTVCKETVCPPCTNPIPIDGHCCPLCKDANAFGAGSGLNEVITPPKSESGSAMLIIPILFIIAAAVVVVVIIILYRRKNINSKAVHMRDQSVRLSSTKQIGSTPALAEEWLKRCDSVYDGQSESLLSTVSDTSTAPSSTSSGVDPHPDTRPLTARKDSRGNLFQCHV